MTFPYKFLYGLVRPLWHPYHKYSLHWQERKRYGSQTIGDRQGKGRKKQNKQIKQGFPLTWSGSSAAATALQVVKWRIFPPAHTHTHNSTRHPRVSYPYSSRDFDTRRDVDHLSFGDPVTGPLYTIGGECFAVLHCNFPS